MTRDEERRVDDLPEERTTGLRFPRFAYAVALVVFGVLTGALGSAVFEFGPKPATLWTVVVALTLGALAMWCLVLTLVSAACLLVPRLATRWLP